MASSAAGRRESKKPVRFEEENHEPLYCVCRQPHTRGIFMIQCDACDEWFHGRCIGVDEDVRATPLSL